MEPKKRYIYDVKNDEVITYDELFEYARTAKYYCPTLQTKSFISYIKNLLTAILNNLPVTLLDEDFTSEELKSFNLEYEVNKPIEITKEKANTVEKIEQSKSMVTLFTSGTTGQPKKVNHPFSNLIRLTKTGPNYINNIWALAYNPTHMAGSQVMFQALCNSNSLIYIFNCKIEKIKSSIEEHQVSHISATPTFYKLLIVDKTIYINVRRVTIGGEKSNQKIYTLLTQCFPNAIINNIYASTEAGSLLVTHNDVFKIPYNLISKIKIINDSIHIHKSLITHLDVLDEWYDTGDEVQCVNKDCSEFKIIGRKSELINIGGYKVNPHEIEEYILQIPLIKNTKVYGKVNSVMGNILCADVETDSNESDIKQQIFEHLKNCVQNYKIPRIIYFKDVEVTRTGKISRKK